MARRERVVKREKRPKAWGFIWTDGASIACRGAQMSISGQSRYGKVKVKMRFSRQLTTFRRRLLRKGIALYHLAPKDQMAALDSNNLVGILSPVSNTISIVR